MDLPLAEPRELAFAIQNALGYGLDGKHLSKTPMHPHAMATHILAHLARCGYVVLQKPPARAFTSPGLG